MVYRYPLNLSGYPDELEDTDSDEQLEDTGSDEQLEDTGSDI